MSEDNIYMLFFVLVIAVVCVGIVCASIGYDEAIDDYCIEMMDVVGAIAYRVDDNTCLVQFEDGVWEEVFPYIQKISDDVKGVER